MTHENDTTTTTPPAPQPAPFRWDDGARWDEPGRVWGGQPDAPAAPPADTTITTEKEPA